MKIALLILSFAALFFTLADMKSQSQTPVKVLVVTGGHDYDTVAFSDMLTDLGNEFTFEFVGFPEAFTMFLPENRNNYDVLVFYHMWQTITDEHKETLSSCIREGKPLVALHHSICAFDGWEEYIRIIGGKYFHVPTVVEGVEYPVSSYEHDRKITLSTVDPNHPVTKSLRDFELFDETYRGFYVSPDVTPLLRTSDPTSTPVIGWAYHYGKARVVTIQSGHDAPTFQNENYRRLLRQALLWVYGKTN